MICDYYFSAINVLQEEMEIKKANKQKHEGTLLLNIRTFS